MRPDPFNVVREFEYAVADYTGARYCVAVTSCTMALLLAVAWHIKKARRTGLWTVPMPPDIQIPKLTYVSVPMSIIHAGGRPAFRDEAWRGAYQLKPLPVWDSARWFTAGMCVGTSSMTSPYVTPFRNLAGQMVCVSFHWSKTLGIQQGGAILHDDAEADYWLRRARFDGRQEGISPRHQDQASWILGWHCYISPEVAAEGLVRLYFLSEHNGPLPNDDYPDLSQMEIFR